MKFLTFTISRKIMILSSFWVNKCIKHLVGVKLLRNIKNNIWVAMDKDVFGLE